MEASFRSVIERVLSICSLLLISGWFLSTFLPQGDTWGLFGILSAAILCCLWWKAPIECSIIDAGIIVVWAYDLLSLAWSINSSPTIIFLYMETTAVVCYFWCATYREPKMEFDGCSVFCARSSGSLSLLVSGRFGFTWTR